MSKLSYEKPQLSLLTEVASSTASCDFIAADTPGGDDGTGCTPGQPKEPEVS